MTHSIDCPRCHRGFDTLPPHGETHASKVGGKPCKGRPVLSIGLPWSDALTQNQLRRMHHHAERRAKDALMTPARWAIRAARLAPIEQTVQVVLHWRPADNRLRDADGIAPTLKVAIDALRHEHVLAEDHARLVPFSGSHIHPARPGMPSVMWVEITTMEEE